MLRHLIPKRFARTSGALLLFTGAAVAAPASDTPTKSITTTLTVTTLAEKLARARELNSGMKDSVAAASALQEVAEKKKDVIRLNCVRVNLDTMRGLVSVADKSLLAMIEAVAKKDGETVDAEYKRTVILDQKVLGLRQDTTVCVGEDLAYIGDTVTTVEIDPSVPGFDPTAFQYPIIDTTRPVVASPPL